MRFTAIGLAVALLVALGVADAVRATRLAAFAGDAQAKLDSIPTAFGDWKGEAKPFEGKLIEAAGAVAHRQIIFTRGGDKPTSVSVLLLAGDPGDMGAHDPERCYGGTGHRRVGERGQKSLSEGGVKHSLWSQRFDRETLPAGSVEVCWSWSADGVWRAAEDARTEFIGRTLIYKLYASRSLPVGDAPDAEGDAIAELFKDLLPLARTALGGTK